MTIRSILVLILRFYAIALGMDFIPQLPSLFVLMRNAGDEGYALMIVAPLGYIGGAVLLWIIAGWLASRMSPEIDRSIQFQMTVEEGISFAFVFLGLYFILQSLGAAVVDGVKLVSVIATVPQGDVMSARAVTDFYRSGITLAVGFACVVGARNWAHKLSRNRRAE